MAFDSGTLAAAARTAADAKKGIDPVILDVRGVSSVTDFLLIVTGTSAPHLRALEEEISKQLKEVGHRRHRTSGAPDSGWVVIDFLGVVVHLFTAERRARYGLEELWGDAPRVT